MDLEEESAANTNVVDSNPIQEALNNDIILANILKTSTNLKNCRRVCKKWNETILSQTPPRLAIVLDNVFQDISPNHVPRMERKLGKKISIFDIPLCCPLHSHDSRNYEDVLIFFSFCREHGDAVEYLQFEGEGNQLFAYKYVLVNNLFPNLRCLEGYFIDCPKLCDYYLNFQTMSKLELINITFDTKNNKEYLQNLIKNAPNLQAIEYQGPFDLDFSQNAKLKSLSIKHFHDSEVNCTAEGLKTMLAQTAQSLEKLKINLWSKNNEDDVGKDENGKKPILVPYPIMPRLIALELNSDNGPQIGQHFDNLGPNFLPNLEYLKLSNNPFETNWCHLELTILEELAERKGSFQHAEVINLALHQVEDPDFLKDIRSFFPNIQSLEVELILTLTNSKGDILASLMKVLIELKLKIIKIIIPFTYDTLELVEALEPSYEKLFDEGLKRFYLENLDKYNTDSLEKGSCVAFKEGKADPILTLEKILLHMKKVQGLEVVFQNFMLNAATVQRIRGFIAENKIPLTFK